MNIEKLKVKICGGPTCREYNEEACQELPNLLKKIDIKSDVDKFCNGRCGTAPNVFIMRGYTELLHFGKVKSNFQNPTTPSQIIEAINNLEIHTQPDNSWGLKKLL